MKKLDARKVYHQTLEEIRISAEMLVQNVKSTEEVILALGMIVIVYIIDLPHIVHVIGCAKVEKVIWLSKETLW